MALQRAPGAPPDFTSFPGARTGWWVCVFALLALTATRAGAAWFSYAFDGYADEPAVVVPALAAARGDFRPEEFLYPGFTSYTTGLVFYLCDLLGYGGAEGFLPEQPGADHFVVARLVVFGLSLATLLMTALAGRRLFGPWAGLAAAALCACSPLFTGMSVISNVNTPASLWTVATVFFAARVYNGGRRTSDYLFAGLCAGLAVGAKYNSYSACLTLVVAHLFAPGAAGERASIARRLTREIGPLVLGGAVAVGAFFAVTPFALLEFGRFVDDLRYLSDIYEKYWPLHTNPSGRTWADYVERMWSFGWPRELFVAACFGACVAIARDARLAAIAGVAALFNWIFLGFYPVYFLRHFLPAVPAFALFTGAAVQWAVERASARSDAPAARPRWIGALVALTLIVGVGARTLALSQARIAKSELIDSRAPAKQWVLEHIPHGSRLVCEERSPFEGADPNYQIRVIRCIVEPDAREEVAHSADYAILTLMGAGKLQREQTFAGAAERYEQFAQRHELLAEFLGRGVQYSGRDIRIFRIKRE